MLLMVVVVLLYWNRNKKQYPERYCYWSKNNINNHTMRKRNCEQQTREMNEPPLMLGWRQCHHHKSIE
jgi:hypothetical protein